MSEQNRGGRPRKYTQTQIEEAIDRIEALGGVPSGATVKQVMRDELGVSPGIDANILDAEVRRICANREEDRARRLAANLPRSAKSAAVGVGSEVTRAVTAFLATQFDELTNESRRREAELKADLGVFRLRVQELVHLVEGKEAVCASLEEEIHNLREQAKQQDEKLMVAMQEIAEHRREAALETQVVALMEKLMQGGPGTEKGVPG